MKNKVFGNQIKEEKLEIFASVPYRSNTGKGKERIWERYRQKEEKLENLSHFHQIQVKFYQLFATVLRWSLEKFEEKIYKYIVRLTGGRRKGRKKLNKQTNKVLKSKENSLTNKQTKNLSDFHQILVKFYQLFATVIRWSLENLKKNYQNYRSFDERGEERKEATKSNAICVFWKKKACGQLNKQTNVKIEKTTPRLKRPSKKKLKSWAPLKSEHFCSFLKKIGLRPA